MDVHVRTWPSRLVARPWLLAFVPINAATAGFAVLLPLLILIPLHGNWVDVATAATVFNVAVILSSVVWGHLSDRYPLRRMFLVLNYGGFAVLYLLLTHVGSIPVLYVIYGVIGLIAPAGTSASNLLILEKFSGQERPSAFASFQEMSIIGSVAGLLLGFVWTEANDALLALVYVLAALAAVSALALWFSIHEAARPLTTRAVSRHPESLLSRLRSSPAFRIPIPFFPRRPKIRPGLLARFRLWAREELHHELPLIMASMFLFNLASNLYNISYIPYLYSIGLGAAAIFLINFSNNFAQTLLFPISGNLSTRLGTARLVKWSTYFRAIGYLATAGFTFVVLTHGGGFSANLVVFGVLGGSIALYTTASSLMLFRGLEGRDAGGLLGINSALGGGAAVLGAGLSGILALFGSYRLVFLVASGCLLVSVPLWAAAAVAASRRGRGTAAGAAAAKAPAAAPIAPPADPTPAAVAKPH
jgi:MFS family permease